MASKSEGDGKQGTLAGLWLEPTAAKRARKTPGPKAEAPQPAIDHPTSINPERRVWTVRDLVTGIRQQVEREYSDLWVEGEISNCRSAPSGHIYFTLKDGEAQLPVVLFRRQAQMLRFRPQDGLAVLVRGRISVYESRGQLQLIAEMVEPRGAGALQLAFEQLKARLLAEGLFDSAHKRPLPAFPRCIGVVTSTGGAVLHDIIRVVRRRHAHLNLLVYPATVQGAGCAASVIAGIRFFNAHPGTADLILIARGGGSIEDLAGFNDETLARTIAASALPVVSAVGHETDFTIADFVADLRAPTPSAAAELITAAQHRIEDRVQSLDARVRRAIRYQIMLARQRFTALSIAQIQNRLQTLLGRRAQRLDDLAPSPRPRHRPPPAQSRRSPRRPHHPRRAPESHRPPGPRASPPGRADQSPPPPRPRHRHAAAARLDRASPACTRSPRSPSCSVATRLSIAPMAKLLRNSADAQPGDPIRARLATGSLEAEVTHYPP